MFPLTLLTALFVHGADASAYPRPELLVEPAALAASLERSDTAVIILDARPAKDYAAGHVPSARSVDAAGWAKAFGDGDDDAGWSTRIGELGIGADSHVVIYDDNLSKDAARVWWILRYWGVEQTQLLNGGWKGWKAAEQPQETETPAPAQATAFEATPAAERLATADELLASLDQGSLQIVDTRSEKEYCGEDKLSNRRGGAIPGAKHLEWSDLLEADTGRFKPAAELDRLFADAGVALDRPTATHCQSGGRASVMAFGLELMGAEQVSNYYRSWSEWGNRDDTPIFSVEERKK